MKKVVEMEWSRLLCLYTSTEQGVEEMTSWAGCCDAIQSPRIFDSPAAVMTD